MRHLMVLGVCLLCLAGCKTSSPPPSNGPGVSVDVPGVRIRVADSPDRSTVDPAAKAATPSR
jgi:hypothetical protein